MGFDQDKRDELEFHLGQLSADLRGALTSVQRAEQSDKASEAAMHLLDASSLLEHDLNHHLAQAESLVETGPGIARRGSAENGSARAVDAVDLLEEALVHFESMAQGVWRSSTSTHDLADLRSVLSRAFESVSTRYRETNQRADLEEPERAAARRRDALLATPRRELRRQDAKTLTVCPQCSAPLTSEDRTHEGSFCENCGTRWIST